MKNIQSRIVVLLVLLGLAVRARGAIAIDDPINVICVAPSLVYWEIPAPVCITVATVESSAISEGTSATAGNGATSQGASTDEGDLGARGRVVASRFATEEELREAFRALAIQSAYYPFDLFDDFRSARFFVLDSKGDIVAKSQELTWKTLWIADPGISEEPEWRKAEGLGSGYSYESLAVLTLDGTAVGDLPEELFLAAGLRKSTSTELRISAKTPVHLAKLSPDVIGILREAALLQGEETVPPSDPRQWILRDWNVDMVLSKLPGDVLDNLILYAVLRKVAVAGDVRAMTSELVNRFPSYLSGLAEVLRYEVAVREGNEVESARARTEVTTKYPGLTWRLKAVQDGHGLLAQAIGLSHKPE